MPSFKEIAAAHQAFYRENILKITEYDTYKTMLTDRDAEAGKIFFEGFKELLPWIKKKYPYEKKRAMYANMLRSEHIPFNFFIPFTLQNYLSYLMEILNAIHPNLNLTRIETLNIEWAPEGKKHHLDDLTSFDMYILAQSNQKRIGIGVEVKYTETSYPYGTTEHRRMFDPQEVSRYHKVSKDSGLYIDGAIKQLRTKSLKQIWRNHLLGAAMLQQDEKKIDLFYSLHLYPSQNLYQQKVCDTYQALIKSEAKHTFIPMTYERFIEIARTVFVNDEKYHDWLSYLWKRYIVENR